MSQYRSDAYAEQNRVIVASGNGSRIPLTNGSTYWDTNNVFKSQRLLTQDPNRIETLIYHEGASNVFIGSDQSVNDQNGYPVPPRRAYRTMANQEIWVWNPNPSTFVWWSAETKGA